jgi:competence protein ComEA
MLQVLRVLVLAASALTFAVSTGASVAAAKDLRRVIIAPTPVNPSPLTEEAINPPTQWPPPGWKPAEPANRCRAVPKGPMVWVGTVNLNAATAKELTRLPGIGPSKAKRIVRWRARHRRFRRILDLRRVKGFGRRSVAKLYRYLTLDGPSTLRQVPAAN